MTRTKPVLNPHEVPVPGRTPPRGVGDAPVRPLAGVTWDDRVALWDAAIAAGYAESLRVLPEDLLRRVREHPRSAVVAQAVAMIDLERADAAAIDRALRDLCGAAA